MSHQETSGRRGNGKDIGKTPPVNWADRFGG